MSIILDLDNQIINVEQSISDEMVEVDDLMKDASTIEDISRWYSNKKITQSIARAVINGFDFSINSRLLTEDHLKLLEASNYELDSHRCYGVVYKPRKYQAPIEVSKAPLPLPTLSRKSKT